MMLGKWDPTGSNWLEILSAVDPREFKDKKLDARFYVSAVLDDQQIDDLELYEKRWNGFFHFINIMQFLDKDFAAVSRKGLDNQTYVLLKNSV